MTKSDDPTRESASQLDRLVATKPGVRTSLSHPLWIDEVKAGNAGGLIGITFCPGKHGPSNSGFVWERDLDTTWLRLRHGSLRRS